MGALRPDTVVLNWLLILPFCAALCAELFPRLNLGAHAEGEGEALKRGPFLLGALASLMGVALGVSLIPQTLGGFPVAVDYWWTKDLYHLRFQADVLTTPVLVVVCGIGLLIHIFLAGNPVIPDPHHRAALLLAAQGCLVGACLSADLILMCFLVQLAVICLWLLVYLDAPRAANAMLTTLFAGSSVFLAGVLLIWNQVGDPSTAPLAMLLVPVAAHALQWICLLVLVGTLPLMAGFPSNGWLLWVADGSPTLVLGPALLLPVAGMCIAIRLLPGSVVLGLLPGLGAVALILGVATLWWGALRAWLTSSLRHLAAWLTISQTGLLLIAMGAATSPTASPDLVRAAVLQVLVAPASLLAVWLGASTVRSRFGTDSIPDLAGVLSKAPAAGVAVLVGGMSLAGLPPLPGFQVQRLLISGLIGDHQVWLAIVALAGDVIVAVAVLDTLRRLVSGIAPASPRWSSPWLSVAVALATIALLVAAGTSGQLTDWSELARRGALSISRSGLSFTP